jgi:MSHA biogenesis protein MshK
MDEALKHLTLLACLTLLHLAASAQPLQDPTRPPAGMDRIALDPALDTSAPRLQSVLIARQPGGRHVAVINGETLRLGERYKGARVASIKPGEVVLVRGSERQVLRMDAPLSGMTPVAR